MITSFQKELAQRLLDRYAGDLSSLAIMFPSLRARAFFNDAVAEIAGAPTWQPTWYGIDEIMERISGLIKGDRIVLISELYRVYVKHHPNEKFDKFYFWGEMLLSDFDMIDKYLIDAHQLLRNIEDIKEIESDVSYLTPEQMRIISFWKSISDSSTLSDQKRSFLEIWRSLSKVYDEFRARLIELGIGYTGMIYRQAAEIIKSGRNVNIPRKHFVIAGFNALSNSEKVLFDYLQHSDLGAEFYWDYDTYYVGNSKHEAGMFMRSNISRYGDNKEINCNNFNAIDKQISVISCTSNVVQCKYVGEMLRSMSSEELDKRTVIVLTDENMLVPTLHSLPEEIKQVNVTMGYPFKMTLTYTFIDRLITLQSHKRGKEGCVQFYHADVTGLLSHPYILNCEPQLAAEHKKSIISNHIISVNREDIATCELFNILFDATDDWSSLSQYLLRVLSYIAEHYTDPIHIEYLRIAIEEIGKLSRSIRRCELPLSNEVFTSLMRRHLQTITIPYEGEPLEGLQIMGILETRNIDFKNVIILSMTDTNFPGDKTTQSSFIPYNLRAAYGMPTPEEHEAMYAYYFYRLIQRAENVTMLYCSNSDKVSTGECSRYIYQLEYESKYNIERISIGVDLNVGAAKSISITKDDKVREILNRYLEPNSGYALSATTLDRYLHCPLSFYFKAVAHIRAADELKDTIDALSFGNILHYSMERLYNEALCDKSAPRSGDKIPLIKDAQQQIEALRAIEQSHIVDTVSDVMSEMLKYGDSPSGDMILVKEIIIKYIRVIIDYDTDKRDGIIIGLEKEIDYEYPISDGRKVNIMGKADRIDIMSDGSMRIIDYKSGKTSHLEFNGIHELFHGKNEHRVSNVFQTLFYSMILYRIEQCESTPSLYFASKMFADDYSPLLKNGKNIVERYSDYANDYEGELTAMLDELFNYDTPFVQTSEEDACKYCDYNKICKRWQEQES